MSLTQQLRGTVTVLKPRLHDTTCCQTGYHTGLTTGCIVYTAGCQIGCCQTGCRTGLTTSLITGCIV